MNSFFGWREAIWTIIRLEAMAAHYNMPMSKDMSKNNAYQQEARDSSIAGFQERQLVINSCAYFVHPIYNLYAASRDGKIIHIIKQVPNTGNKNHNGCMRCMVRKYGDKNRKTYSVHRFA